MKSKRNPDAPERPAGTTFDEKFPRIHNKWAKLSIFVLGSAWIVFAVTDNTGSESIWPPILVLVPLLAIALYYRREIYQTIKYAWNPRNPLP